MLKLKEEYLYKTIEFGYPLGEKRNTKEIDPSYYDLYNKWYPFLFNECPCPGVVCICDITSDKKKKK